MDNNIHLRVSSISGDRAHIRITEKEKESLEVVLNKLPVDIFNVESRIVMDGEQWITSNSYEEVVSKINQTLLKLANAKDE